MESSAENPGRRRGNRPMRLGGEAVRCGSWLPEDSAPPADGRIGRSCPAQVSRTKTTAARPDRRSADGHPTRKTVTIRHAFIQPKPANRVKAKPDCYASASSHHLFGSQFVKSRDLTSSDHLPYRPCPGAGGPDSVVWLVDYRRRAGSCRLDLCASYLALTIRAVRNHWLAIRVKRFVKLVALLSEDLSDRL